MILLWLTLDGFYFFTFYLFPLYLYFVDALFYYLILAGQKITDMAWSPTRVDVAFFPGNLDASLVS